MFIWCIWAGGLSTIPISNEIMQLTCDGRTRSQEVDFNPFPNTPLSDHPKFKEAADDN